MGEAGIVWFIKLRVVFIKDRRQFTNNFKQTIATDQSELIVFYLNIFFIKHKKEVGSMNYI